MADLVFNIAKGKVAQYAALPLTNDAFIAVPIETSGIVSDATMRDYADLGTLIAGASNEQTTMGRKTMTGVAATVDNTADKMLVDADDVVWTAAAGNAISAVVICYDADTTSGTDTNLVPLVKLDCAMTPDGSDFTMQFAAGGFYSAV
jgi:hypothetical protein